MSRVLSDTGFVMMSVGWVAVYLIAVYSIFKYKARIIPALAIAANFAWEGYTAVVYPNVPFIIGFLLDIVIFISVFYLPGTDTRMKIWVGITFVATLAHTFIADRFVSDGWRIICFIIDVLMAALFLSEIYPAKVAPWYIRWAAVARLIGDLGAFIACRDNPIIVCMGITVLLINIVYCVVAFRKPKKQPTRR